MKLFISCAAVVLLSGCAIKGQTLVASSEVDITAVRPLNQNSTKFKVHAKNKTNKVLCYEVNWILEGLSYVPLGVVELPANTTVPIGRLIEDSGNGTLLKARVAYIDVWDC